MAENLGINIIESVQVIVNNMQEIEKKFFEAQKLMTNLNERQNDLVHALEFDITEKEVFTVAKALQELRKERREVKDALINLEEAKNFVAGNYKFMNEAVELVKKMEKNSEWASNRKYFVRDCDAIQKVIDLTKYERISFNRSQVEAEVENKEETQTTSQVEKFAKRMRKAKAQ